MLFSAKDIIGKIFGIFFPIASFVICGFEHCVANMYYIPAGIFAAGNEDYLTKAQELYGITAEQCAVFSSPMIIRSFICVTLGNIIGGVVCAEFRCMRRISIQAIRNNYGGTSCIQRQRNDIII